MEFVTGRAAEEWKLAGTELPDALKTDGVEAVQDSCGKRLAPLVVRAVYESEPLTASGAWRPWGVHVSTAHSPKPTRWPSSGRIRGAVSPRC